MTEKVRIIGRDSCFGRRYAEGVKFRRRAAVAKLLFDSAAIAMPGREERKKEKERRRKAEEAAKHNREKAERALRRLQAADDIELEDAIRQAEPLSGWLPRLGGALENAKLRLAKLNEALDRDERDDFMSRVERAEKRDEEAKALQGAEGAEDGRGSPEVGPSGVEGAFWQSYFADLFVEHDEDSNGALDMQEFLKVMEVIAPTVAQEELKAAFMAADVDNGGTIDLDEFLANAPRFAKFANDDRGSPPLGARRPSVALDARASGAAPPGMSREERRAARLLFKQCDEDGNGSLDRREFANVMRRLCPGIDDANIAAAFVALDTDESGTIELDEFVRGQPVLEEEKKKWRQKKKPRRKKSLLEPKEGFLEGGRKFTAF